MTGKSATSLLALALAFPVIAISAVATEPTGGPRAGPGQTQELQDEIKDGLSSTSGAQFVKAIEGTCERQKTGKDYQFTTVWKEDATGWKLARVLSYDHNLTD